MQAEPKKRGRKSAADKAAEAAIAQVVPDVAPVVHVAPVFAPNPIPEAPVMPLIDYIKTKERDFPPLVEITHPEAADGGFHAGVYSGIRLKRGPCAALYSDATTD